MTLALPLRRLASCCLLGFLAAPLFAVGEAPLPADLPALAADRPLPVPELVETRLANGLEVWVLTRPGLPRVMARLVARAGTAVDPAGLEGIAELLAATLKSGTTRRSARTLAEELQALGGSLDAGAGRDELWLTVDGFSTEVDPLLEILADVALSPAFPEMEVLRERDRALQTLAAQEASAAFPVEKALAAALYGAHPYRTTAVSRRALEAATPELLRTQARRLRPERAAVLVVGAVDGAAVARRVEALFGAWQGEGEAPPLPPLAPAPPPRRLLVVDRPGAIQAEIRVSHAIPRVVEPGSYPALVAATLLGGSFSSRLMQNLREDKGYAYGAQSVTRNYAQGSLVVASVGTRTETVGPALLELFYELDRLALLNASEAELELAQRYLAGWQLLGYQTQALLLRDLTRYWVRGLPARSFADFVPRLRAVTLEDVRRIAREYFVSHGQTVVIGGDAAAILPQLEIFGGAEVIKP